MPLGVSERMKCVNAGSLPGMRWHSIRAGNECPHDCYRGSADIDNAGESRAGGGVRSSLFGLFGVSIPLGWQGGGVQAGD